MTYFRFKTFTTSYYFPTLQTHQQYMYGLYSAYGSKLSKIYWNTFKKYNIALAHGDFCPWNILMSRKSNKTH